MRMFWIDFALGFGFDLVYSPVSASVDCFVSKSAATDSLRFARSSTAAFGRGSF